MSGRIGMVKMGFRLQAGMEKFALKQDPRVKNMILRTEPLLRRTLGRTPFIGPLFHFQAGGIRTEGRGDIGDLLAVLGPHGAKQALIISKGIDKNLLFILKRIRNITGDVKMLFDLPTVQEIYTLDYSKITEADISGYFAHLMDMKAKLLIEGTAKMGEVGDRNIAKINTALENYDVHQALIISHERFGPNFLLNNDESLSKMKDLFVLLRTFRIAERIKDVKVFSANEREVGIGILGLGAIAKAALPDVFVHALNLWSQNANLLIEPNEGGEQ